MFVVRLFVLLQLLGFVVLGAGCPNPSDASGDSSGASGAEVDDGGTSTVGASTVGASTGEPSSSTGPIAECGNGAMGAGEDCDGTDFGAATCESLGQAPGTLSCTEGCTIDVVGCVPPGMVLIPGGTFEMGSTNNSNEQPIRQVEVDAFWMDETEVTVEAYSACVDDGVCSAPLTDTYCNWMVAGREDHPMNCAAWYTAEEYCGWAEGGTKRLPTEAEWEKAARGTDAREYPWGDIPAPSCTHVVMSEGGLGCGIGSTWPVGSKPLGDSPYGAHDMAGNVWEWVADWYAMSYDAAQTDNPTGPAMGTDHVLRGGSLDDFSGTGYFHAAHRSFNSPPFDGRWSEGFRCARTPPAPL